MRSATTSLITGYVVLITVIILALCGAVVWGAIQIESRAHDSHSQVLELLQADALAECHRVQGVRIEANRDARILHDVLQGASRAIRHTPAPRKARALRLKTAAIYLRYARLERYYPPTNCMLAISEGTNYRRPATRPFPSVR